MRVYRELFADSFFVMVIDCASGAASDCSDRCARASTNQGTRRGATRRTKADPFDTLANRMTFPIVGIAMAVMMHDIGVGGHRRRGEACYG